MISWDSCFVNTVGISFSRPSGLPPSVAHRRVKPPISPQGPAAAACFFQLCREEGVEWSAIGAVLGLGMYADPTIIDQHVSLLAGRRS
eukprot:scaffold321472_cov32-Tisochrysis_lutea.AAC.2